METTFKLILASGSPRRKELLSEAGYNFEVIVSAAEESSDEHLSPVDVAKHNATIKAAAVAEAVEDIEGEPLNLIIGADTVVALDGHLFGKPTDEEGAANTLRALSGKTHQVTTGVCLVCGGALLSFAETTDVTFKDISDEEIAAYVKSGEPMDKAGAYGIQGKGGALVDCIEGDYDNVVGLPVAKLTSKLDLLGVPRGL